MRDKRRSGTTGTSGRSTDLDEPGRDLLLGAPDEASGVEEEEDGRGGRGDGGGIDVAFEVEAGVAREDVGCLFEHCDGGL